jgi:hypothetical protein
MLETVQLEPFAEVTGDTCRFEYRTVGIGDSVSEIELPLAIVEQAVLTRASITAKVSLDGTVISHMRMPHVAGSTIDLPTGLASIEALVQKAVDSENLRMEEATSADLRMLLQRLEDSVRSVKSAITKWQAQHPTSI